MKSAMILVLLGLLGLLAVAHADQEEVHHEETDLEEEHHEETHPHCGPLEQILVKHQWALVYGNGHGRITFARTIFKIILRHHPEARKLLKHFHADDLFSHQFEAFMMRIFGGIDMCIALLDDRDTLHTLLNYMHQEHVHLHLPGHFYDVFGKALMEVVSTKMERKQLGCYVQKAWKACYDVIKDGLQGKFEHHEEHHEEEHHEEEHNEEHDEEVTMEEHHEEKQEEEHQEEEVTTEEHHEEKQEEEHHEEEHKEEPNEEVTNEEHHEETQQEEHHEEEPAEEPPQEEENAA